VSYLLEALSSELENAILQLIDERVTEVMGRLHPESPRSPWLTVQEAADYLRTTPQAVYKRIKRKQLQAYRPEGSGILLHRDELDAAMGLDPKHKRS
jgi:excisionase family DNA binding protein